MSESFVGLMYHNVVADGDAATRAGTATLSPSITGYFVDRERFARQLDTLQGVADVLSVSDVREFYARRSEGQAVKPRPRVQITFDDGWRGSVDVAGPLLAERGLQSLLFPTTGLIGRPHFLPAAELARLPRETFHVGSHTVTHPFLNELDDASITDELQRSKSALEDIMGYEVDSLSVPNGAVDRRVIRIAVACGYRFVYVSSVHRNSLRRGPLTIGRIAVRANTTAKTIERYARGDVYRERARAAVLSLPKRVLGSASYRKVRRMLLGETPGAQEMCDLLKMGESVHTAQAARLRSGSPCVMSSGVKS
jgi:peptidoglycan/xylan/chitin deacetylase (PgdA/CDA1 family)